MIRLWEMMQAEQHRMIQSLKGLYLRMDKDERSAFEMMQKRDRDDEDLDSLSLGKLNQLYSKYATKRTKQELDKQWKKLTGG